MTVRPIILLISCLSLTPLLSQNLPPAPVDKAVIYFTRTSSLGFAINFTYFDSTQVIGVFNGPKYMRYECEPGRHLFWARSENRDFIDAEVEAGKIYFIEAIVKMGAVKAGVELLPIIPTNTAKMKKIISLIEKKTSEEFSQIELDTETTELREVIKRGLNKNAEDKAVGKTNKQLGKEMNHEF